LFNWRGQFTPQLVDYILESFSKKGDCVIDPFSGSGTVLQGCSTKAMSCYGYEINPAAYAMSKFFTLVNSSTNDRRVALSSLHNRLLEIMPSKRDLPLVQDSDDYRIRYRHLLNLAGDLFPQITNKDERVLAINTLLMAESRKRRDLGTTVLHAFDLIKNAVLTLPNAEIPIRARLSDARLVHNYHSSDVSLILTSPPYINVFNYHQNHRAILETLGWNVLKVAESEIGSNRKNRANRFRTVVQYCLDIEQALVSFWKCLKINGLVVLVVGRESNVRSVPFYNGAIIKDLMIRMGSFRTVATYERKFLNRFGSRIKEDIIVAAKSKIAPNGSSAKEVALKHLKLGLRKSTAETRENITEVLGHLDDIGPSPLFKTKEAFANA